ncbi:MAG: HU family DNA-binding protein [bacterium]|nr:HU family DNA-binding protein [bacterium]
MTKENLVEAVLKFAKCETKKQAQEAVEAVFATITKSLSRGEDVTVTGFGTFRTVKVAARSGRNPKTGESLNIPASIKPKFKAGKALKEAVK